MDKKNPEDTPDKDGKKNEKVIIVDDVELMSQDVAGDKDLGDFNASKISDIDYLYDIFAKKYDKFNSLSYLKKNHTDLLNQGYPQTPALNEYLFWTTIARRLQIIYNMTHKAMYDTLTDKNSPEKSENVKLLDTIQKTTAHIDKLQKAIDSSLETTRKVRDVVDLHRETCEKAEKFLKAHFGEYIRADSVSGKLKNITDQAHWAFVTDVIKTELGNEHVDYVWSEELKFLVDKKLVPLQYMAFILQTSIEGLYHTAKIRNDKMDEIDKETAEDILKELMIEFETLRHEKDKEITG